MEDDLSALVARSYDAMGHEYTADAIATRTASTHYRDFLDRCLGRVPRGGLVLDLGCGGGIVTAELSERAHVVGVDISFAQLQAVRSQAPSAMLVQADMRNVAFGLGSFDAVAAFWSVIHLPRELHADLFVRIGGWLRSGGILFGTLGESDNPRERADFHGQPMYWSHFDAQTNRQLLRDAGFHLMEGEVVRQRGEESLWIIASR